MPRFFSLGLLVLLFVLFGAPSLFAAGGNILYVASTGDDQGGNSFCTDKTAPCLTIAQAITKAISGDTIKVAKGDYTATVALNPGAKDIIFDGGYDEAEGVPYATRNLGVRGDYMTRLIGANGLAVFRFDNPNNASTVRNFVLQPDAASVVYCGAGLVATTTTIDSNTIIGLNNNGIYVADTLAAPTIQNNIILEASYGVYVDAAASAAGEIAVNNTVVNASSAAFSSVGGGDGGTRTNNIAYGGVTAFENCAVSQATYNDSYLNTNDYADNCPDASNLTGVNPKWTDSATGVTTGLGLVAPTLTLAGAGWTVDQWKGYFVTPDISALKPQYFFIISNTADTLMVESLLDMKNYATNGLIGGGGGDTFQITDFTLQAASGVIDMGTDTGAPVNDIYWIERPQNALFDIGATEYEPPPTPGISGTAPDQMIEVTEGGATATLSIVLDSQPTDDVTIEMSTAWQALVDPTVLTFTVNDWDQPQTVTVTAWDDWDIEGDHADEIQYLVTSLDNDYNVIVLAGTPVAITDNDVGGVTITETQGSTTVTEGGETDTYTVVLTADPAGDVYVTTIPISDQVTIDPQILLFNDDNWSTPQEVTVTALDDAVVEGIHTTELISSVMSEDVNFNGVFVPPLTVTIIDNDVAAVEAPPVNPVGAAPETVVADAGSDQTMTSGGSITLDGSGSEAASNVPLTYYWKVVSGEAALSDPFSSQTDLSVSSDTGSEAVTVQLTVTSQSGTSASDEAKILVIGNSDVTVEPLAKTPAALVECGVVYEDRIETNGSQTTVLAVGKSVIMLPEGISDYKLATTTDRRLAIGLKDADGGAGKVYLSKDSIDKLPAITRLAYDKTVFYTKAGSKAGDYLGKSLAIGDLNGDGIQKVIATAQSDGAYKNGVAYVYDANMNVNATVYGSTEYKISSVTTANVMSSTKQDLYFSNAKSAAVLAQSNETYSTVTSTSFVMEGSSVMADANVSLAAQPVSMTYESMPVSSTAVGDLNNDGYSDVAQVSESKINIYYGGNYLKTVSAAVKADLIISGESTARFAEKIVIADVTGDGISDAVFACPDCGVAGKMYVMFGTKETRVAALGVQSGSIRSLEAVRGKAVTEINVKNKLASIATIEAPAGVTGFGAGLAIADTDCDGGANIVVTDGAGNAFEVAFPTSATVEIAGAMSNDRQYAEGAGCSIQNELKSYPAGRGWAVYLVIFFPVVALTFARRTCRYNKYLIYCKY